MLRPIKKLKLIHADEKSVPRSIDYEPETHPDDPVPGLIEKCYCYYDSNLNQTITCAYCLADDQLIGDYIGNT